MAVPAVIINGLRKLKVSNINKGFDFLFFKLSEDKDLLTGFFENEFVLKAGYNAFHRILDSPYLYLLGDLELLKKAFEIHDTHKLLEKLNDLLFAFTLGLWFIKDNSVHNDFMHIYIPTTKGTSALASDKLFSNASGEFVETTFTIEELEAAKNIFFKINSISKYKSLPLDSEFKDVVPSSISSVPYNDQSRIDRAILFLSFARSSTLLPLKISFYIAMYECLFTTENTEVTHRVTERATFYLGGSYETKANNFKLIKAAYDVRSKFVHGQQLEKVKKREDLVLLSNQIDALTRTLLTRIITTEDYNLFLKKDDDLRAWFIQLVLGQGHNNEDNK